MIVAGIDIGVRGAIALIDAQTRELIEVFDMPTLADGPKGRSAVNAPLLADLIYRAHIGHAFVELVGARPGEGVAGAFSFGRSRGVVDGVLGAAGVPATHITPPVWKRAVGIPTGKEGAKCEFRFNPDGDSDLKPDRYSETKPDTDSDLKPAT